MCATVQHSGEQDSPENVVRVDGASLSRVGARVSFPKYLAKLWEFRAFIMFDSRSRIAGGSSADNLGNVWLVLNPVLNGATYFLVFGILLGTGKGIENFIAYLIIGVFMFRFTTSSILSGAKSLTNNRSVVRAFNFPRATLPIAVNVRELMVQIPALAAMFVLIIVMPPLEPFTWKAFLFIPVVIMQFLFNLGLSLLLARLVTRWNDLTHLITFGTRVWLYLSCVFYGVDRFEDQPLLIGLMEANPMFCVLDIARDVLLYDTMPDPSRWLVLGGWTLALLIVGSLAFWQAEESYGQEY